MDVSFTMQDISGGTDCGKNEINQFLIHSINEEEREKQEMFIFNDLSS